MTEPERTHPEEPAEGADVSEDAGETGRTPHPEEPAEGGDVGGGGSADTPG